MRQVTLSDEVSVRKMTVFSPEERFSQKGLFRWENHQRWYPSYVQFSSSILVATDLATRKGCTGGYGARTPAPLVLYCILNYSRASASKCVHRLVLASLLNGAPDKICPRKCYDVPPIRQGLSPPWNPGHNPNFGDLRAGKPTGSTSIKSFFSSD